MSQQDLQSAVEEIVAVFESDKAHGKKLRMLRRILERLLVLHKPQA